MVLRASAQRRLGALDLARRDLATALWLLPDDPDGLLERGILRRLTGDAAGARDDWLRAATLDPEGPAGATARAKLEELDVKAE
jgi:regulator of sirC expression with transglutaminase-like and TPR domain